MKVVDLSNHEYLRNYHNNYLQINGKGYLGVCNDTLRALITVSISANRLNISAKMLTLCCTNYVKAALIDDDQGYLVATGHTDASHTI